jgi:NAD(P)-dependent dehydrogenase (short-subunit alcohol dehydrogenase family)
MNYHPWTAYAQAKTANILHAAGLRYKFGDEGLAAFAVHPGCEWRVKFFQGVRTNYQSHRRARVSTSDK